MFTFVPSMKHLIHTSTYIILYNKTTILIGKSALKYRCRHANFQSGVEKPKIKCTFRCGILFGVTKKIGISCLVRQIMQNISVVQLI